MFVCGNTSAFLGISFPLMRRGACDDPAKKSRELDAALSVVRWRRILWTRERSRLPRSPSATCL
ncbi:unnamed protein product [Musa hybrid cultivar]